MLDAMIRYSLRNRLFILVASMNGPMIESLNYLVETFASIMVSTVEGLFLGAFQDTIVKGREDKFSGFCIMTS